MTLTILVLTDYSRLGEVQDDLDDLVAWRRSRKKKRRRVDFNLWPRETELRNYLSKYVSHLDCSQ